MPIDQDQINRLLDISTESTQSDRVFMIEGGNMATAIDWFKRITGQQLSLFDLTRAKASGDTRAKQSGGFFIHTYQGTVNGQQVNVNLRGGSSSSIVTERLVTLMTRDFRYLGEAEYSTTTPGCPTIDITNPGALGAVPRIVNCKGRVEFKFTTTFVYG